MSSNHASTKHQKLEWKLAQNFHKEKLWYMRRSIKDESSEFKVESPWSKERSSDESVGSPKTLLPSSEPLVARSSLEELCPYAKTLLEIDSYLRNMESIKMKELNVFPSTKKQSNVQRLYKNTIPGHGMGILRFVSGQ